MITWKTMTMSYQRSLGLCGLVFFATTLYSEQAQQIPPAGNPNSSTDELLPPPVRTKTSPAKAPHVTCQDGQLMIVADNSTMSSVFTAIHACIGVDIQAPVGFKDDRTFITLGPGPARAVLNEFLSGTDFDYVILSSLSNSREIQSIQLTARPKETRDGKDASAAADLTMTPARRLWLAARSAGRPTTSEENETAADGSEAGVPVQDGSTSGSVETKDPVAGADAKDQLSDQKQDQPNQKQDQSKDQPQENSGSSAPSTGLPAVAPGSGTAAPPTSETTDGSQTAPEPSPLQKQINQMEQLFEQRKQMSAKPTSPAPNPDPSQN